MNRTLLGQAAIYNGGLQSGLQIQSGAGVGKFLSKAENVAGKFSDFAKRNRLLSAADTAIGFVPGAKGYLDSATGGMYSNVVKAGKQAGYGKKKKSHKKKK